jgi:phosphatidylserine/phosphatidylglycerophosphate/cardiolipin synthase-like enzyme
MNMQRFAFLILGAWTASTAVGQANIAEARTNPVGTTVTVTGVVTSGPEFGTVRYIQDGTAGIALYPGGNWDGWSTPAIGDEVTMTAALSEYNGLLEVGPDGITQVTINSTGNPMPAPQVVTPGQLNESLEGEWVLIENALFTNGGQVVSGNATYAFTANGQEGIIYVRSSNPLVGTVLSAGAVNLYGIVSQFSFTGSGGYQLLPRGPQDVVATSPINIASQVRQENLSTTGFDLEWSTDVAGSSEVQYGITPALGLVASNPTPTTNHSVSLTGLTPGTIYYARCLSVLEDDTTFSAIRPYATVSESAGWIRAYFTTAVEPDVATIETAVALGAATNDTIATYILSAAHTLDIAAYNINNSVIVDAINQAAANGVQVRYIAEGSNANVGIDDFNASIPVHFRTDGLGSGMHNKFIVGDAEYTDRAFVLTGSTNFTTENLTTDPNNLVILQDESLAKAYTLEFEEMWGGSGMQPNPANSKFGAFKTMNTPRKFEIGGTPVELYFSPTDGTTQAIRESILSTDYDFSFALLSFTRDDLAQAIIEVGSSIFINPVGLMEDANVTGSEFDILLDAGIQVYSHVGVPGQLHHKYAIVDQSQPLSDPQVITGSHNWSNTAETTNDENTLIIHDARVANLFYQEFVGLLASVGVVIGVEDAATTAQVLQVFPNPAQDRWTLAFSAENWDAGREVICLDARGTCVFRFRPSSPVEHIDVSGWARGMYWMTAGDGMAPVRLVLQ